MNMINRFLKAKHWVLFILTFGIPMIIEIVMMSFMFSDLMTYAKSMDSDPLQSLKYMKFIPPIMIFYMIFLYGWFWSVAIGLQKKVPVTLKMKVKKFKFFFFFPMIYMVLFMFAFFFLFSHITTQNVDFNPGIAGIIFVIVFPIHLFAMFCMFYIYYFVAKTIKTVELQREVTFGDFVAEFFLILFFPIGIWVIQPTINKMVQ